MYRSTGIETKNKWGEWVPAIPLPMYGFFFGVRCWRCIDHGDKKRRSYTFWSTQRYREHYALVHILGLD